MHDAHASDCMKLSNDTSLTDAPNRHASFHMTTKQALDKNRSRNQECPWAPERDAKIKEVKLRFL